MGPGARVLLGHAYITLSRHICCKGGRSLLKLFLHSPQRINLCLCLHMLHVHTCVFVCEHAHMLCVAHIRGFMGHRLVLAQVRAALGLKQEADARSSFSCSLATAGSTTCLILPWMPSWSNPKVGLLSLAGMESPSGLAGLFSPASSGHLRNCRFWYLISFDFKKKNSFLFSCGGYQWESCHPLDDIND